MDIAQVRVDARHTRIVELLWKLLHPPLWSPLQDVFAPKRFVEVTSPQIWDEVRSSGYEDLVHQ